MPQISADIPVHDADLVGDQLTALVVNYRWRRIITPLLMPLCRDTFWAGTEAEIEDATYKAIRMILDLYDVDDMHRLACRIKTTITHNVDGINFLEAEFSDPATTIETYDFGGFWSAAKPKRLTVPAGGDGIYICSAYAFFDVAALGLRMMNLNKNVFQNIAQTWDYHDNFFALSITGQMELAAGDELLLQLFADDPLTLFTSPLIAMVRVAR